jgi:hypothetical protein
MQYLRPQKSIRFYYFYVTQKYNVIQLEILHTDRLHHYHHPDFFFQKKLEIQNIVFKFSKSGATCSPSYFAVSDWYMH